MNGVNLPRWLEQSLEDMVPAHSASHLKAAYQKLSQRYQKSPDQAGLRSFEEAQAYAYVRMPATYAVVRSVLQKLPASFNPNSMVDFGAGPGTATWAALDYFTNLTDITCIEQDPWMHRLLAYFKNEQTNVHVEYHDYRTYQLKGLVDLGIFCYSLNELSPSHQIALLKNLDDFQFIICIFPGTPYHFANLKALRQNFIEKGWIIHAPCPHQLACPMGAQDWCHFSGRLPRLKHHRTFKGAELNYEDEKYSYLVVSKESWREASQARLIKRPIKRSGHVILDVCEDGELHRLTVGKKDPHYPAAKKKEWGDLLSRSSDH